MMIDKRELHPVMFVARVPSGTQLLMAWAGAPIGVNGTWVPLTPDLVNGHGEAFVVLSALLMKSTRSCRPNQ
jgi:hypothetical protein